MLFIFLFLVIISRLRKSVALHLNKLESISPKNVFAKIDWNSACSSWEEDFFKVVNVLIFKFLLFLEKSVALYLKKKLNALISMMHCGRFSKNFSGSGEEDETVKSLKTDGLIQQMTRKA